MRQGEKRTPPGENSVTRYSLMRISKELAWHHCLWMTLLTSERSRVPIKLYSSHLFLLLSESQTPFTAPPLGASPESRIL